ncbi:hypothetical protein [Roseiterribacter gracilis]|uniref:hypothetical protein n=1 Tax=Roseiterribacter gracilis TaxID=2812848 RepID=UPI003B4352FC
MLFGLPVDLAAATELELAPLVDVARGRYGYDETTTSWSNLVTATVREGAYAFEATSGYVVVNGPAAAGTQGAVGGGTPFAHRRTGLADTVIGANWRDQVSERLWLQTGLELKLPTADATRGLGTGAVDGTARLRAAWLGWRVTPFIDGSFSVLGSSNEVQPRDTAWSAGIGAAMRFEAGFSAGLYGEIRQPVVVDSRTVQSVMLFGETALTDTLSVSAWAALGTGTLAVKQRAGLRLTWRTAG